jgi:RNA polymerase sigma-70 factor (ECF subfamily)
MGRTVLASLDVDERLEHYQPLHAARAELLARSGDTDAYRKAIALTENASERRALEARAARL